MASTDSHRPVDETANLDLWRCSNGVKNNRDCDFVFPIIEQPYSQVVTLGAYKSCCNHSAFILDLDFARDLKLLMVQMKGSEGSQWKNAGLVCECFPPRCHVLHLCFSFGFDQMFKHIHLDLLQNHPFSAISCTCKVVVYFNTFKSVVCQIDFMFGTKTTCDAHW